MPDDLDQINETALASANELITGFVQHIPYVAGTFAVILITWLLTRTIDSFGQKEPLPTRQLDRRLLDGRQPGDIRP